MSELLNNKNLGAVDLKQIAKQHEMLIDKWEESGLLTELSGINKTNMASLLECEATGLLTEGDCCDNCKKNKK